MPVTHSQARYSGIEVPDIIIADDRVGAIIMFALNRNQLREDITREWKIGSLHEPGTLSLFAELNSTTRTCKE